MEIIKVKDKFVTKRILTHAYHPLLVALYYSIDDIAPWFRKIITSAYRPGKGVHGTDPCRGIDLRCHSHWVGEYLEKKISGYWSYDIIRPHKKCVIYHTSTDENGYHLHLQVHPNTKYIGEKRNKKIADNVALYKLWDNVKDLEPEFSKTVDENLWDLVLKEEKRK